MSWQSSGILPGITSPATDITKLTNDLAQLRAVLGGATDADIPHSIAASLVSSSDAGGYYTGTTAEAQLQEAGKSLAGRGKDIRTFANIVADGTTDDFAALQAAIVTAEAAGQDIWIPDGVFLKVLFTTTNANIFIHGNISIRGANGKNCGFKIDKNYANSPIVHAPLFCFGIASRGATVDAWTGTLDNVGFVLVSGCLSFERCCHFYEWQRATVSNCWYDGRAVTFTLGQQAGGFLSSNRQPSWATGQTNAYGITVYNNEGHASAYYQNMESIAFTYIYDSVIAFNKVYGFSDDMAIHGGANNSFVYNINKPVLGRFYFEDVQHTLIHGNHLERCKDPSNAYTVATGATGIRVSSVPTYAVLNGEPANANNTISSNRVVMPEGSYMSACIYVENHQDGLRITDNTFDNQGTGTLDTATGTISVVQVATLGAWTGPAGNPDFSNGGVVRCRRVAIHGNQCIGEGWSATEGNCGISFAAGAGVALGPFRVYNNLLGAYFMPYSTIDFDKSNRALAVSTGAFTNVSAITLVRSLPIVHTSVMTAGQTLNVTGHPIGTPADMLDAGGLDFYAAADGSLRGVRLKVAVAASAPNFCFLRVLKNGTQLGADISAATITPTTNFVSYFFNFFGAAMEVAAGDKLKFQLYFAAGQTVALTGNFEAFLLYK